MMRIRTGYCHRLQPAGGRRNGRQEGVEGVAAQESHIPVYPIGVVQRLTGLSARQIRYYEKEGLLSPSRTRGNRRLYSVADVQRLRQVKDLLAQGLNLEGARAYLQAQERSSEPLPFPQEARKVAQAGAPAREAGPVGTEDGIEARKTLESLHHPGVFRQARGRRLSSLFPVDHQDELVRWLEDARGSESQQAHV